MRLTESQRRKIKATVEVMLGRDVSIVLFGSRVNDDLRGGDIDLMITLSHTVSRPSVLASRIASRLERVLNGRNVDVILVTPDTVKQSIHKIAERQGIVL